MRQSTISQLPMFIIFVIELNLIKSQLLQLRFSWRAHVCFSALFMVDTDHCMAIWRAYALAYLTLDFPSAWNE